MTRRLRLVTSYDYNVSMSDSVGEAVVRRTQRKLTAQKKLHLFMLQESEQKAMHGEDLLKMRETIRRVHPIT